MPSLFNPSALEDSVSFLDDCPPAILGELITLPQGTLAERVAGARTWHDALLNGHLPPAGTWPGKPFDAPIRSALETMGLTRFLKGQQELVDAVLRDIVVATRTRISKFQSDVADELNRLADLERKRIADKQEAASKRRKQKPVPRPELDEKTLEKLRQQAQATMADRPSVPDQTLLDTWSERARAWAQVADVFGDLGNLLGRGWDFSLGVLKHTGWLDIVRLRALIEKLPQLAEIVASLGRLQANSDGESVTQTIFEPVSRLEEERLKVRSPLVPAETRGIERSADIARMLPVEAAMLGHPALRMLWHARRAERALLTYRLEGIEVERRLVETESMQERETRRPRPVRGPIIAIIDTSGSMHGRPEQVAKAIVLQAVRTAHAEKRQCFLLAFSGPGQIAEYELNLSESGLSELFRFLGLSFGGGTDEQAVIKRTLDLLADNDWKKADVIMVSDGEWPASKRLLKPLQAARENGTRFHGVQIGNRGRTGLHAVCDPVHEFNDWAAAGGWR